MLKELIIENVAVIEKAEVTFNKGLNVLTGETGAGKSILIDAINAIIGNRTSKDIVRTGADKAAIWAVFDGVGPETEAQLREMGYEPEEELLINREISAYGKGKCRINGKPATAQALRDICSALINIHGQHDSQDLMNPERHIHILDAYGDLESDCESYRETYSELTKVQSAIKSINTDEAYKQRRIDLLSYQIEEISSANLAEGEEEQLQERRAIIRNSEKLREALGTASAALSGDEGRGALELLYEASGSLSSVAGISESLARTAERLNDAYYLLTDIAEDVKAAFGDFDYSLEDADFVEERLDLIHRLKLKYGSSVAEILGFLEEASRELADIETGDQRLAELESRREQLLAEAKRKAAILTDKRREAFGSFQQRIKGELQFLNMPNVVLSCGHKIGELTSKGQDSIEFFISTNPGEPPKPMAKIASGGELSRIMLAIKNVLADKDSINTLIFDEIDTGVSGSGAQKIGTKLKQASGTRQIICVTHSAPIAAYADCHLLISKAVRDGRTFTSVEPLSFQQRKAEIARIVSGESVTETSLKNAEEMIIASSGITE